MPTVATDALSVAARAEIWRIGDRRTFSALRHRGRRARTGPITLTWLPADVDGLVTPPRVAFAVGKQVGGAVVRNRIRRRLRAALRELQATTGLPTGAYLIGATGVVARLPWPTLVATLSEVVALATGREA